MPKEADANQTISFRNLLLNKCQQEFEKDKVEELDIAERQKLIEEATSVSSAIDHFSGRLRSNHLVTHVISSHRIGSSLPFVCLSDYPHDSSNRCG